MTLQLQLVGNAVRRIQRIAQQPQFVEFLHRKRQPRLDFGIKRSFGFQIDRHVQQRTTRRQPQPLPQIALQRRQRGAGGIKIAAPDVASVENASGEDHRRWQV